MTDQEQNIVVAAYCLPKWQKLQIGDKTSYYLIGDGWHILPNYGQSLDAMHEAEKQLTDDQHCSFRCYLERVTYIGDNVPIIRNERANISPSASQRREAFLRTIGKWKDAPQREDL